MLFLVAWFYLTYYETISKCLFKWLTRLKLFPHFLQVLLLSLQTASLGMVVIISVFIPLLPPVCCFWSLGLFNLWWTTFKCLFKLSTRLKLFPHFWHVLLLSLQTASLGMVVIISVFILLLPHVCCFWLLGLFNLLWTSSKCLFKWLTRLKLFSHFLQVRSLGLFNLLWTSCKCLFKLLKLLKLFPHFLQILLLSLQTASLGMVVIISVFIPLLPPVCCFWSLGLFNLWWKYKCLCKILTLLKLFPHFLQILLLSLQTASLGMVVIISVFIPMLPPVCCVWSLGLFNLLWTSSKCLFKLLKLLKLFPHFLQILLLSIQTASLGMVAIISVIYFLCFHLFVVFGRLVYLT